MIDGDRPQAVGAWQHAIEGHPDGVPRHRGGHLQDRTLTTPVIDRRQDAKRPAVGQGVVDEVHAPALAGAGRHRRGAAMQGDVLAPSHPHPQLQAIQAIQGAHALLVHRPALPAQQHPDAHVAESWSRVRQCADPGAERRLVVARRPAVPRGSAELRQMTGPHAADAEGPVDPIGQLAALQGPQTFFAGPR